ncbi:hypothetical protein LINPERHAP2_LOCUS17343 [Linum perenne]
MTSTSSSLLLHFPLFSSTKLHRSNPSNLLSFPSVRKPNHRLKAAAVATGMADEQSGSAVVNPDGPMKLLFVEMGVGYDQHGVLIADRILMLRRCVRVGMPSLRIQFLLSVEGRFLGFQWSK